jgi:hypothetical protein
MLNLTQRLTRSSTAAAEDAPDDKLVLDLSSGRYFGVGPVGAFIWDHLDGTLDLATIAQKTAAHFGVEADRATADLVEFVTELVDNGLAHPVSST